MEIGTTLSDSVALLSPSSSSSLSESNVVVLSWYWIHPCYCCCSYVQSICDKCSCTLSSFFFTTLSVCLFVSVSLSLLLSVSPCLSVSVCPSVCMQELYREYTDLTRQHEAEIDARRKQQQSHIESLHSTATAAAAAAAAADGDDDANSTKDRLSRMVRFYLLIVKVKVGYLL